MKLCLYAILFLMSYGKALAQCNYQDYEKFISENCVDCNQSQVNIFVYKKCREADSLLTQSRERFHNKVTKQFNGSNTEKHEVEEKYNKSFEALTRARDIVFKNYDSLTISGGNLNYTQLFYWYFTDKANEIVKDMESTVFGD